MSDTPKMVHIFDCATGEETIREMTAEEIAAEEEYVREEALQREAENEEIAAQNATLQSSRDKFADMGLTAEEIAAIVPADKELRLGPDEIPELVA
jgi:hypothetical protein